MACSNEIRSGIVLDEGVDVVKIVAMCVQAGTPLAHEPMNPIRIELPGLLLEPLHQRRFDVVCSELLSFNEFLRGLNQWKSRGDRSGLY
jgi:hypothetical protein